VHKERRIFTITIVMIEASEEERERCRRNGCWGSKVNLVMTWAPFHDRPSWSRPLLSIRSWNY